MNVNGIEVDASFEYKEKRLWLGLGGGQLNYDAGDVILFYEEDKKALWRAEITELDYSPHYGLWYYNLKNVTRLL